MTKDTGSLVSGSSHWRVDGVTCLVFAYGGSRRGGNEESVCAVWPLKCLEVLPGVGCSSLRLRREERAGQLDS